MTLDFLTFLPKCLKNSIMCYTLVDSNLISSGPTITTCNSNGYMYEVKNQNILHSLDLEGEKSISISCYFLVENERLVLFYLVYTANKKLLLIRGNNKFLEIVKVYEDVKEFDVYDYQCIGYPQIKIVFFNLKESIITFLINEVTTKDFFKFDHEKVIHQDTDKVTDCLAEKLQLINLHIDELTEEKHNLKKLCKTDIEYEENYLCILPTGTVNFSSPLKNVLNLKVKLISTWCKFFKKHFVFGMKIHSFSYLDILDLELLISYENIKNYLYAFFSLPGIHTGKSVRPSYVTSSINPGDEFYIASAIQIPMFLKEQEISLKYDLIYSGHESLVSKIHNLSVSHIAKEQSAKFEKQFTVEDWMSIMILKTETKFKIKTQESYFESKSQKLNLVESVLMENLGFKRINHLQNKLFYCTSTYLNEVFVCFEPMASSSTTQSITVYTDCEAEIYFFVHGLYGGLPNRTTILVDDHNNEKG